MEYFVIQYRAAGGCIECADMAAFKAARINTNFVSHEFRVILAV